MRTFNPPSPPLVRRCAAPLALACACAFICASAQAQETLEGTLERGPAHSVLWAVSPESGDLIGQVFANTSPAGQTILAHCLPGLHCVAEGAIATEPPEDLPGQLRFGDQPSGWWLVTRARSAAMQASLPLSERELRTRHGLLSITDEHLLLLNGRPVLASPPQAEPPASAPAPALAPAPTASGHAPKPQPPALMERLRAWLGSWWHQLRGLLAGWLGSAPARAPQAEATPEPPPQPPAAGTAEAVQGNAALHIVAHFESEDRDTVLLQDTGGTACPALYRFATLTPQGIAVTPAFGTCSDIATAALDTAPGSTPVVTMTGFLGPFEPEEEQQRAHLQLHRFALRQGQVAELQAPR